MSEIVLKASLLNGRLHIESVDEPSSVALSKWIDDNRHLLNVWLDIELLAHDHMN